ncbi:MAG: hypothetical protein ABI969_12065 [bacterium]
MHLYALHLDPIPRNMLHLHTDRLADLGDSTPTPEEAAHLASCDVCAHEVSAYQTLVAMARAELEPFGLPLTRWDAIAAELAQQQDASVPDVRRAPHSNRRILQIAAGLLLVAGGAMLGRISAGVRALPDSSVTQTASAASSTGLTQTSATTSPNSVVFGSAKEARAAQQRSELLYQQAAAFLARVDTTGAGSGSPVAYRSRLAALDQMISTTREAMREAPHDPVINGYYLTTLGQREATLRQLNTALPASLRVNSF